MKEFRLVKDYYYKYFDNIIKVLNILFLLYLYL